MEFFASSTNLAIAFIGAIGMLLIFGAITGIFRPKQKYDDFFEQEDDVFSLTLKDESPILDRLVGEHVSGLARRLATLLGSQAEDERRLTEAGYPKPFNTLGDFYAWKIILSIGFFVVTLWVAISTGNTFMLPASFLSGVYGLYMPDINLKSKAKERQEGFEMEMAFTMDRLAMLVQAGESIERSLRHIAASGGGYFIKEMRNVADLLNTRIPLNEALEDVIPRFPLESYEEFVSAIMMSLERGTGLHHVLKTFSSNLQSRMENTLLAKGTASTIPMVLGISLALIGIFLAVGGPAAYVFIQGNF